MINHTENSKLKFMEVKSENGLIYNMVVKQFEFAAPGPATATGSLTEPLFSAINMCARASKQTTFRGPPMHLDQLIATQNFLDIYLEPLV